MRYEQLKRELLAELGYFDFDTEEAAAAVSGAHRHRHGADRERRSRTSRASRARRNPFVQLYLYPAKVQGEGAAESIARGVRYFDRQRRGHHHHRAGAAAPPRTLWAFNERVVADSIFEAEDAESSPARAMKWI